MVDALDESNEVVRRDLLREIRKLNVAKISLMVTSRSTTGDVRNDDIIKCDRCETENITLYFRCQICDGGNYDICYSCKKNSTTCLDVLHVLVEPYSRIELDIRTPIDVIERYIRREIGTKLGDEDSIIRDERLHPEPLDTTRFQDMCKQNPKLIEKIPRVIKERADGKFLYAKLYIDSLKVLPTVHHIKKALEKFPPELDGIYAEAMQRIGAQRSEDKKLAFRVLAFMVCAHQNMDLLELQELLAVEEFGLEFAELMTAIATVRLTTIGPRPPRTLKRLSSTALLGLSLLTVMRSLWG